MKCYIFTRFSISNKKPYKGFAKKNLNNYLYSDERLKYRFKVFKEVTLKSITKQKDKDFIWYIFAGNEMPKNWHEKLEKMVSPFKFIKVVKVKSFEDFKKERKSIIKKSNTDYVTVRLDDDDGLSSSYIQKLKKHSTSSKRIISFVNGSRFSLKNNQIVFSGWHSQKNIAPGLAAFNMDIYECGNHMEVHKKFDTVYDYSKAVYSLHCHPTLTDTGRKADGTK